MDEVDDADLVVERVAALDLGKAGLEACVRVPNPQRPGRRMQELRGYATTTAQLLAMAAWLRHWHVQRVVMESTSTYWKGVYYLLEAEGFDCWLVNAREVKNVPGRRQDRLVDRTTARILWRGACGVGFGWLGSLLVISDGDVPRELSGLVVPRRGCLEATGDLFQPYRLVDGDGAVVVPVAAFFRRVGGVRAAGDDAAFLRDGSVALVPVLVGARGGAGIRRLGSRRAISAVGCRSRVKPTGRIGGVRTVTSRGSGRERTRRG